MVTYWILCCEALHFINERIASFSLSSWNIQGLYSSTFGLKTSHPEFIDSINNIDLIILHETWRHDNTPSNCPSNYNELSLPSLKYPHIKNGRHSGGIIIWYRQEHHNYILPVKEGKTHIWLKISRRLLEKSWCLSVHYLFTTFKLTILLRRISPWNSERNSLLPITQLHIVMRSLQCQNWQRNRFY